MILSAQKNCQQACFWGLKNKHFWLWALTVYRYDICALRLPGIPTSKAGPFLSESISTTLKFDTVTRVESGIPRFKNKSPDDKTPADFLMSPSADCCIVARCLMNFWCLMNFLHKTLYVTVVQPSCSRAACICGLPEPDGAKAAVSLEVISGVRSPTTYIARWPESAAFRFNISLVENGTWKLEKKNVEKTSAWINFCSPKQKKCRSLDWRVGYLPSIWHNKKNMFCELKKVTSSDHPKLWHPRDPWPMWTRWYILIDISKPAQSKRLQTQSTTR